MRNFITEIDDMAIYDGHIQFLFLTIQNGIKEQKKANSKMGQDIWEKALEALKQEFPTNLPLQF